MLKEEVIKDAKINLFHQKKNADQKVLMKSMTSCACIVYKANPHDEKFLA
jgi:hypothetical protein